MIKYVRLLLFPLSILYGFIILIRNKLYDWGIFKSTAFDLPVICIGNLVVGGSGKTPLTEYLVRLLEGNKIAILSRGYGRKTKGFMLANDMATAETIGDEPMQYYQKFKNITVAVCEDRVFGINQLKANHDLILLDDAYQHRAVKPGFSILLFEYEKLKHWQFLLPAGNLREQFANYDRANAILITKTPLPLNMMDQIEVRRKIDTRIDQRISFSGIKYGELVHLITKEVKTEIEGETIFLLTGIANPKPLANYLTQFSSDIQSFEYADHYNFTRENINDLIIAFNNHPAKQKIVVTTEKDSQRLLGNSLKDLLLNLPIYFMPIEIELAPKDKFTFDKNILEYVASDKRINEFLQKKIGDFKPEVGIVLGTGLGGLVNEIEVSHSIMYSAIPNFPISTLEFHSGKLIFGNLKGKKVVAMQGRLHFYEGYSMKQITFPIRVLKELGIKNLFVSNAAGSLNPEFKKGDLMIINDHINLQPESPLRGINDSDQGPRFPDMSQPYQKNLIVEGLKIAKAEDITCHQGIYISVTGPNLETKAEYKYLRIIGGDAVGMSTVPEVIVANHMNLPVFAISVLTDEGFPEELKPVSLEEIIATAAIAEPKMTKILTELISIL